MLPLTRKITSWLEGLRFPVLLLFTAALFVANVFIPDVLPFVDELLLAMATILLARIKRRKPPGKDDNGEGASSTTNQD